MKEETRVFTGGLNKDDDPRFLPNGDWIDALNASVLNREGTGGDIVAEIGNEEISLYRSSGSTAYSLPSGTNTTIGSVDDAVRGHTYWFVHNSNNNHVILRYEYDTNIARPVLEDNNPASSTTFSVTTEYSRGDVVSSGGNFYTLGREDFLSRKTATAYDAGTDIITLGLSFHYYKTGDRITYNSNGGSITGLSDGTVYYAINVSPTTIKVAESFAKALSGDAIDLTGTFSGSPYFEDSLGVANTDIWYQSHNVLNFNTTYPIYKSIVVEQSGRVYLIWTDNNEQPSFLEVTSLGSTPTYRGALDLYAPQPHHPPTAEYGNDSAVDQNNVAKKALQFRYSWKYSDGRTTVLSPISRIAMPNVANYNNIQLDNKVQLQIPLPFEQDPQEATLYVKTNGDNNTGDWYLVNTFDVSEETISENPCPYGDRYLRYIAYDFFNTSTLSAVARTIQDQIQDFIPIKSKALSLSGNGRLLLGNNLDGFDFDTSTLDVTIEATNTPEAPLNGDAPLSSAKKGCRYPMGIVYGDRSGRLSTVYRNDDMVLEAPFWNFSNRGQVKAKMSIGHAPPSWANFWIPVYAGNQTMGGWRQSAASSLFSPDIFLKDIFDYNSGRDEAGYNYTFYSGQYLRGVWDESTKGFFDVTNGDARVASASSYVLKVTPSFSTNIDNNDVVEVYTNKQQTNVDELLWYEMGWAFNIGTDVNGNKVHTAVNSSYGIVDDYANTEYTVTAVDTTLNRITIGAGHDYQTGDAFYYSQGVNSITPLVSDTVYYAIRVSSTVISVATTKANALSSTAINLTASAGVSQKLYGNNTTFEVQDQIIGTGSKDCVVVLDQFDCYIRNMSNVETTASTYKAFEFKNLFPFYESEISGIGRPNVFNQDFKQTRREQEIVFSEPLVDNTDFFGINRFFDVSFNDSLNNDYGELTVMHSDGNEILCIQETKVARMLANKNFIYTGDLQSIDIQSNVFLSKPQYFPQDFGCQNPESFADYGGVKFWVDRLKGAVLMSAGDEVKNIAQNKMSNYFESNLPYPYPYNDNADGNNNKIYGGYSIRDNSYYLSLDAHKTIKRIIDSSNDPEYVVTMTDLDIADGTFDRIVDFGTMPIKRIVGSNYDTPLFGMTVTASDSSAKTITIDVGASLGYLSAVEIYVPYVDTLSFSLDRGRWISKHSFNPEWIGSSANSIITFKSGKAYVHQLATYETAFFSTSFNFARFYGTTYNTFIEFPFNQELNIVKEPITIATDSNQVFNIDYAVNESEQITDNEITDYEEFEGYYWSPIFKDKTTPVVTYPLLEGDLVKGKYLKARLKATTDGNQQASISSVKLKYNNSNLT